MKGKENGIKEKVESASAKFPTCVSELKVSIPGLWNKTQNTLWEIALTACRLERKPRQMVHS